MPGFHSHDDDFLYEEQCVVSSAPMRDDPYLGSKFLTTKQLCALLHVSTKTVQRWRNANLITYTMIGGQFRYPVSGVETFIARRTMTARADR